jgi:hypothetical protein
VRVLRAALGVRLLAFGSLLALAIMALDGQRWLALPIFTTFHRISWCSVSPLSESLQR